MWLWIAAHSQHFKSMEVQPTMYQILDTLVPWLHLSQVTSKGESHLLGVRSGSYKNFGRVRTYRLQQRLSYLILLVPLYYSMTVNHGWSPRTWKTKSTPLLPHATESCWVSNVLTMFWTPPSIPWLTLCLWFTWLGTASWNFLVTSSECQRKSLLEDMLCTSQPLAKWDLVDHVLRTLPMSKDCLGIMKEQCKNSRLPHLLMIVMHGETLWRLPRSRWMIMLGVSVASVFL